MATTEDSEFANVEMVDAALTFNCSESDVESTKHVMVRRVADADKHFAHLRQRDEPDMSLAERLEIVEKLLATNPGEFLARFGSELTAEDLQYFDTRCSGDYIVNFRMTEIRQRLNDAGGKVHHTAIKNRRYVIIFAGFGSYCRACDIMWTINLAI